MARSATFFVSDRGGFYGAVGTNHAGLECDRGSGEPYYVTWNGTTRGADWGNIQNRLSRLSWLRNTMTMPAHMKIGFDTIYAMNPVNLVYENRANPQSYFGANPLNAARDYVNPVTHAPIATLQVKIPVRAPGGVACGPDDNLFGLDVDKIWNWWFNILMLPPDDPRRTYCKISTMNSTSVNCCGMVGLGLREGGLGIYASEPTNLFYQGSASLLRWVNKAVKRIDELNQQRKTIMASLDYQNTTTFPEGKQAADFHFFQDLPDLDSWKKRSAVQEGIRTGFARRKEQVAEIDRLLPLYHAARAHALANAGSVGSDVWMDLMTQIHDQCFCHLIEKPNSDRRRPMLMLAKTIHEALYGFNWAQREAMSPPAADSCVAFVGGYNRF